MTKEYKPKPLEEVLQSRKKFYLGMACEAFEKVYKSCDLGYITRFENEFLALGKRAMAGKLEGMALEAEETSPVKSRTRKKPIDARPRLTYYQYAKARDAGTTNEQIKKKFRMNSSYQICGFAGTYAKRNKQNGEK